MFEAVEELVGEHADLEKKLADPSVHADQANARKLNKRYAELTPIVAHVPLLEADRRRHRAPRASSPPTTRTSPPRSRSWRSSARS